MSSKQPDHFISLIIPAFKQVDTIVENIRQVQSVMDQIRYDSEIVVVIDGEDGSLKAIQKAKLKNVYCISYVKNQGKSYAIRLGMKQSRGDYIMFLDAGQEIDPNGISMLLEHIEWYDADIIVGSKRHPASHVEYPLSRQILSHGYFWLVKILFGITVKDTQAGIKIFRKAMLQKVLPRLVEKKFAGDLEILVVAKKLGFKRVYEAPIKMKYGIGGITSAATLRAIVGILIDTLAIWYRSTFTNFYATARSSIKIPKDSVIYNAYE